jgi:hypothetical protein
MDPDVPGLSLRTRRKISGHRLSPEFPSLSIVNPQSSINDHMPCVERDAFNEHALCVERAPFSLRNRR